MPLQQLKLRPGVNRESTTLSNEGTWFEMDKVRFRSGYPEKIGGWVKDAGESADADLQPPAGSFWGVCRSLWNWVTTTGNNLLGVGTNLKFYLQNSVGGDFNDITPIRDTSTVASNAFTTTNGSMVVTVNDTSHGASTGDFVYISGVGGAINGIPAASLNSEFQVTYVDADHYTITVDAPATSSGTTGAADFEYEIPVGQAIYTVQTGWGAGGFGGVTGAATTGWGESAASGVGVQMRLWSQDNFGDYLLMNYRDGPLYLWVPSASSGTYPRAQVLSSTNTNTQDGTAYWTTDTSCPSVAKFITVSDNSRFVIAFGCNDYGETAQDPMLIRWSDQESYAVWAPAITNQAGSFRLSSGSQIIGAYQSRQEILVWTDAAIYSMQYLGPPYVWGVQILSDNISIASPNAMATAANVTYWMGVDKFYMYTGRVETLYCPLRQYIFGDINTNQMFQVVSGTDEGFNEVWWFYCSSGSDVVDRYVIYNHLEKTWSYGNMSRTFWLDSPLRPGPTAAGYDGQIIYHEQGVDDGTTNPPSPITSYVQSADFDIGDGHNYGFVWRMIPDITFDGSTVNQPAVTFTLRPRQNPGSAYGTGDTPSVTSAQNYSAQRNYTVQEFTEIVYTRIRGRQMAFKVSSDGLGVQWQLGAPRIDIRPDGRR